MICSSIAELREACNKKIEKGMKQSRIPMQDLTKKSAPPYVYVNCNDATGQTIDSIRGKMGGARTVIIDHDYGMITPIAPRYHMSIIDGSSFAGATFITAMHNGGRSGRFNPQIAVPTLHMEKIASNHRGEFVRIAKSNIE